LQDGAKAVGWEQHQLIAKVRTTSSEYIIYRSIWSHSTV